MWIDCCDASPVAGDCGAMPGWCEVANDSTLPHFQRRPIGDTNVHVWEVDLNYDR